MTQFARVPSAFTTSPARNTALEEALAAGLRVVRLAKADWMNPVLDGCSLWKLVDESRSSVLDWERLPAASTGGCVGV